MIRIGFWGPWYYTYNKEPPQKKNSIGHYLGPYIRPGIPWARDLHHIGTADALELGADFGLQTLSPKP